MKCESSFQWSNWISIISTGLLQIYVIYSSLLRYINLRFEIFNGYHVHFNQYRWIMYLFNFQLFVIIVALGIVPLWLYSVIFSSSSFGCNALSPKLNRQGFQELVFRKATDCLNQSKTEKNVLSERTNSNNSGYQQSKNIGTLFPVASILHVTMAYLLILPLPFIEAWLIQTDHANKEDTSTNDVDFLVSNSLTTKIKWSVEYFNLLISLCVFTLQYPNLVWPTNKLFSVAFNLTEFVIILHILIDFPVISTVIKSNVKNCNTCSHGTEEVLKGVTIILTSSIIGNIFFLLTFFAIFHFAYEKCVQALSRSTFFYNNYRMDFASSVNNVNRNPYQSNNSSSVLFSLDKSRYIKTSPFPFVCAAMFFLSGISIKGIVYYLYQVIPKDSKLFLIYLIQSLMMIVVYLMFWFGIIMRPKWVFKLKDAERKLCSQNSSAQKEDLNYSKLIKGPFKTSQTSLSSLSNTNLSFHSLQNQKTSNRIDFTNPDPYSGKCNSLKFMMQNKDNHELSDYIQLNQHLSQGRPYNTMYPVITSPKPLVEDRGSATSPLGNYYKCVNTNSMIRSANSIRYEDSYQGNKKSKMEFSIQEETSNENVSSISDDLSSNVTASPNAELNSKINSNGKIVTFRLENNAELSVTRSSSSSDESLTVISLEQSEAFLKELEGDGSEKKNFSSFKKDISSDFREKFILPLEPINEDYKIFTTTQNQTKVSLL